MLRKTGKAVLLAALVAAAGALPSGCSGAASPQRRMEGNTALFTDAGDFQGGRLDGTSVSSGGGGEIALKEAGKKGTYLSGTIAAGPFQNLLFSCNADTPGDSTVQAELQVEREGEWSGWLNWGVWGSSVKSGSSLTGEQDAVAGISEDVLQVADGKTADAFRYRLTLSRNTSEEGPAVRSVAVSVRGADAAGAAEKTADTAEPSGKVLDVPRFSQMTRDPQIAADICGPTSVAMVLNYYGIGVLPEEAAWGGYDNSGLLFGNWAYNCAYAGSYGLTAYTEYLGSMSDVKREIAGGSPVVLSVRYRNSESVDADLPVLHGAPIEKTEGHLLVVCGFESRGGKEYAVVNDPAAADDGGVRVEYRSDELWNASFRVAYVIRRESGRPAEPRRLRAELVPTGKTRDGLDGTETQYRLAFGGKAVDIGRDAARTILFTLDGKQYQYLTPNSEGTLWLGADPEGKSRSFLFVCADRRVYSAQLDPTRSG